MTRKIVFLLALFLTLQNAARAQNTDLKALLFRPTNQNALTLKDLNSEWRVMNAGADAGGNGGNMMSVWLRMISDAASASSLYTKGDTVVIGGETFVIVYRPATKAFNLAALMNARGAQNPAPPEPFTPDTKLTMALLNLKNLAGLNDIHPFDLKTELAAHQPPPAPPATEASLKNLKTLGTALMMYAQDYDAVLPPMKKYEKTQEVILPYVKDLNAFTNPDTKEPYKANPVISEISLAKIAEPAATVAFYEAGPAKDGTRGVCFADGHAKRIKEDEWPALKARNKIP